MDDRDEEETVMHHTSKLCLYNISVLKEKDEFLVCQKCGGKGLNFKG